MKVEEGFMSGSSGLFVLLVIPLCLCSLKLRWIAHARGHYDTSHHSHLRCSAYQLWEVLP